MVDEAVVRDVVVDAVIDAIDSCSAREDRRRALAAHERALVAREFMNQMPEQGVVYLAALVALDMCRDEAAPDPDKPSKN
ncbi:MAG TPA: hypothetical protein VF384_03970 [Planctomycetota bacterium]